MERLKQPVEFHLIAISCSFSRLSKAVTIVTAVKGRRSGFGLKSFFDPAGQSNSARWRYSNDSATGIH